MSREYIIKAKKIVTVGKDKTIINGAMVIKEDKIIDIGKEKVIISKYKGLDIEDLGNLVITPSLIDCHTHLLEYAPSTVYPVTSETYNIAQKALVLKALMAGVTTFGEQICGSPMTLLSVEDFKKLAKDLPVNIVFSCNSITIGFEELVNFTAVTGNNSVDKDKLIEDKIINSLIEKSDYPGENIFINATPANLTEDIVPRAGEVIYTQEELENIVQVFHSKGKRIGCHVAGKDAIEMAIKANFDVIHHGHGITDDEINEVSKNKISIVATPLGGTHLKPNSPEDILKLIQNNILVAIATDAYLPPYEGVSWLNFNDKEAKGSPELMIISKLVIDKLIGSGYDENEALSLITLNAAKVLGIEEKIGSLEIGKDADFIVSSGIPVVEFSDASNIKRVYLKGKCLINRI